MSVLAAVPVQKSEDAVHSSGDKGTLALGVRKDTAASLAGTDGDYTAPIFDASGRQHVINSAIEKAEDAAHNSGDYGIMALGVRRDALTALAGTTGDYIPFATDEIGKVYVNASPYITRSYEEATTVAVTSQSYALYDLMGTVLTLSNVLSPYYFAYMGTLKSISISVTKSVTVADMYVVLSSTAFAESGSTVATDGSPFELIGVDRQNVRHVIKIASADFVPLYGGISYAYKQVELPVYSTTGATLYAALVAGGTWNLTGLANSIEASFHFES